MAGELSSMITGLEWLPPPSFQPYVPNLEKSQPRDSPQLFVANLWTEFAAQRGRALAANGKEPQNLDFPRWLQPSKWQILNELPVV
jgi:hypothetical protein